MDQLQTTREFWDANPCGVHSHYEQQKHQRYVMEPWLPGAVIKIAQREKSILEVGCGQGIDSTLLCANMAPDGEYVGIDYSPNSVAAAQANATALTERLVVKP